MIKKNKAAWLSMSMLTTFYDGLTEQSCSCDGGGGGVTYTAVSDSGCREYIMDPPGAATGTMTCPSDLIWDTTACTCNFASQATCASGCQGMTIQLPYSSQIEQLHCFTYLLQDI